jgi:DNA (cytosine-5)-methyltransferase 1
VKVLSLFTGVGGFDLGLERAGMEIIGQAENDPKARRVLEHRWPGVTLHHDVHDITADDHPDVDLVCGGFPCQDISVAGKQKGINRGDKSVLWWEFYRVIHDLRPRWVLIENVANLLNINSGRDLGAIIGSLDELGYVGEWRVLDSQGFGVPQRRRRVFIVGHLGKGSGQPVLLEPEGGTGGHQASGETGEKVAALTANGVGTCGADDNQAQTGHLVPATPQPYLEVTGTLTTAFGPKNFTNLQEIALGSMVPVAFHRTQDPISGSVVPALGATSGGAGIHEPAGVRRLTPRECERLQGFPDDWTLVPDGSRMMADTHRYRFMGNAVTVNVAEWIGRRIMAADE